MNIEVMICQNDNQGNLTNLAHMMDFSIGGEIFLQIEPVHMQGVTCFCDDPTDRIIEIYGVRVKRYPKQTWVGNMMWNLYQTPPDYALGLINTIMRSREWHCMEAWETIFEKWKKLEEITGHDLDLPEDIKGQVIIADQYNLNLFK